MYNSGLSSWNVPIGEMTKRRKYAKINEKIKKLKMEWTVRKWLFEDVQIYLFELGQ